MPRRIAVNTLNASTIDILNVIRQNASYDYQQNVPEVASANDIPRVGEVLYGTPALANQFLTALINRIALVRIRSANFNNPYSRLKKGYLEFGETVEEIFVGIAKVVEFNPEKAPAREFQRTFPDVKSAFHTMNWRVVYPVTIQDEDLRQAFLSLSGVQDMIARIVDSIYTAAEYDEFLLFKYLLIKSISAGKFAPVSIGDGTDLKNSAVQFRGISNLLQFMNTGYNEAGVRTSTPRDRQAIFMDSIFNAQFDVDVLASAFNMDRANFVGALHLIDDWTTFDNDRFEVIRANSDGIEEVTQAELALLQNVKAVIIDEDWFQIYDNNNKFTEKYVASGMYWNYFYHTWKTVSYSPFANAVVFALDAANVTLPQSFTATVQSKSVSEGATVITLVPNETDTLQPSNVQFEQTEALTTAGIGVHPFGAYLVPTSEVGNAMTPVANINGTQYTASQAVTPSTLAVGATVNFTQG